MIKLKDTYEKIFETVWHNYTCGDIDPDLSDFQDNFQGDFSEFLTSCFQGKKGWYRISQNDEIGKLPHRSVFGERLELII